MRYILTYWSSEVSTTEPFEKEYFFDSSFYAEVRGSPGIVKPQDLRKHRFAGNWDFRKDISIKNIECKIHEFADKRYSFNADDPYWCFYMTCLGRDFWSQFFVTSFEEIKRRGEAGVLRTF